METTRDEMGRLLPGHKGLKPKGARSELRKKVQEFVTERWDEMPAMFDSLKPKDKMAFMVEILPYVLPKMKQIEGSLTVDQVSTNFDFTRLSEAALKEVLTLTNIEDE